MKHVALLALVVAGCTSTEPLLGSGGFATNRISDGTATAWAEHGYAFPHDQAVPAYIITFAIGGAGQPCSTRAALPSSPRSLTILTGQPVDTRVGAPAMFASELALQPGDIAIHPDDATSAISERYASFSGVYPEPTGILHLTAVDPDGLTGTFEATGMDLVEKRDFSGSFDVMICP